MVGAGTLFLVLRDLEGAVVVAPHQPVHASAVLKVLVDAPLMHEARDELTVALVVLHCVVALGVALDQAFGGGKGVALGHGFNYFNGRHILEHLEVGGKRC